MQNREPMTLIEADWFEARAAARALGSVLSSRAVAVHDSCGRVLAEDCYALCDLPSADSSAMDGWAVAGAGPWTIVGDVRAGHTLERTLSPGHAVRIATGGVLPVGADSVIRWEHAARDGQVLRGATWPGRDIRRSGEECRLGELVAEEGADVSPALAGLLAATGHDEVVVAARPRVALLLLGDELLTAGLPVNGRVRDSLGPQLPGWLRRLGAVVTEGVQVADELATLVAALGEAGHSCDLVVTTGGTAAGPRDHLHAAIAELGGALVVDRVAVRPGHPMLLATLPIDGRQVPLVGLPGNPHSAVAALMTLGAPLVAAMLGRSSPESSRVPAREELRSPTGHTRLIAGVLAAGEFCLSPYGGSAMLRGLAQSTGFAVVPAGVVPAGGLVEWLALP
jgi:molybdopterin molybdotransferase